MPKRSRKLSGAPVPSPNRVVDFRVKLKDGSYELVEVKGFETDEYKLKKRLLKIMWLPDHPDHTYLVVK